MTSVFEAALPTVNYVQAQHPDQAHAVIGPAREQSPIAMGPFGPELLSYELVREALRDPRLPVPPGMFLAAQGITSGPLWDRVAVNIVSRNGEDHVRLRRLLSKAFTPRSIAGLRDAVTAIITELVDGVVAQGHCDVVSDIARRYPIPIICTLLGAPAEDWELFSQWIDHIMHGFSMNAAEHMSEILTAWEQLDAYIDQMVARRRVSTTDDLLSALIHAEEDGDRLSGDELRMLVAGLLIAGTDTTRHQLAASVQVLLEHPEQWALLGRRPELAEAAVEETMRHTPAALSTVRMAGEDVELAGLSVPAGTVLMVNVAAANRDSAVFSEPDRLDITREGAPPIMTFGGGEHFCIGSHLARLELAEALRVMSQRMPNARVVGPAPWPAMMALAAPATLPIAF